MIYKKYGEIFKELREERELPQSHFKSLGISNSKISRFESGFVMLAFDELNEALQMMGISLHEYNFLINNGQADYFIEILEEIDHSFYIEDWKRLAEIYEEQIKYKESRLIAYSAKACYGSLNEEEQREVTDYLFIVEHWGAKELHIFMDTIDQLSSTLVYSLLRDFLAKSSYYKLD